MPLKCWSQCDAITAICLIRFDRKVAICMKFVTHCWLLKEYSCSEYWDLTRFRRTSRNPCCSTRAISLSRCWPSIERAPPTPGSRREAVDVAAKRRSASWREENRRVPNGDHVNPIIADGRGVLGARVSSLGKYA